MDSCSSAQIPSCPIGYTASEANPCDYRCVPMDRCACANDGDCVAPSICDFAEKRCRFASAPQPRCQQPFDAGSCDGAVPVYAFVGGQCQQAVWGGCYTNDNRFDTLQACISACIGAPLEQDCPDGMTPATMCPACGATGGCPDYGQYCAQPCSSDAECVGLGLSCSNGVCQATGCM